MLAGAGGQHQMARPYSQDLRDRAAARNRTNHTVSAGFVAKRLAPAGPAARRAAVKEILNCAQFPRPRTNFRGCGRGSEFSRTVTPGGSGLPRLASTAVTTPAVTAARIPPLRSVPSQNNSKQRAVHFVLADIEPPIRRVSRCPPR